MTFVRECLGNFHREIKIFLASVPKPDKWIFIVGCYNSGTTLLSNLLSLHHEISALPTEGHFLTNQFVKDFEIGVPRMWMLAEERFRLTEKDKGPNADRIKKEWGIRLDLKKKIFVEKSPPNSVRMRWLQEHFKNSYFIEIVRNGYAVAEGIRRKGNPLHLIEGWPIEFCAKQWVRHIEIVADDSKYLDRFISIKYEDVTENTSFILNQITDFIGIERFPNNWSNITFAVHERNEPIRNLNEYSIHCLSSSDIEIINSIAMSKLTELGYKIIRC